MSKLIEIYQYRKTHARSLQKELPDPTQTHIPEFDETKTEGLSMACFPTGPAQLSNAFEEALIDQINEAKESIFIAHLYFTPTRRILDALIAAAHRGLQITILTNKAGRQNPYMNKGFVDRSRLYCKKLLEGHANPKVKIYQYDVPRVTYHKKVIIIDNQTLLTGSANLGTKSFERYDYEIDFVVQSPKLVSQVLEVLQEDLCACTLLSDDEAAYPSPATEILGYSLGAFKGVV